MMGHSNIFQSLEYENVVFVDENADWQSRYIAMSRCCVKLYLLVSAVPRQTEIGCSERYFPDLQFIQKVTDWIFDMDSESARNPEWPVLIAHVWALLVARTFRRFYSEAPAMIHCKLPLAGALIASSSIIAQYLLRHIFWLRCALAAKRVESNSFLAAIASHEAAAMFTFPSYPDWLSCSYAELKKKIHYLVMLGKLMGCPHLFGTKKLMCIQIENTISWQQSRAALAIANVTNFISHRFLLLSCFFASCKIFELVSILFNPSFSILK